MPLESTDVTTSLTVDIRTTGIRYKDPRRLRGSNLRKRGTSVTLAPHATQSNLKGVLSPLRPWTMRLAADKLFVLLSIFAPCLACTRPQATTLQRSSRPIAAVVPRPELASQASPPLSASQARLRDSSRRPRRCDDHLIPQERPHHQPA
jgi:hypothetical protein